MNSFEQNFKNNLLALKNQNKELVEALKSIKENVNFEPFQDGDKSIDINIKNVKTDQNIYKNTTNDLSDVITKCIVDMKNYEYLYFFGFGNGYLFKSLCSNHKANLLCVIEPELEIIYIALNLNDFSSEIKSNKLVILWAEQIYSKDILLDIFAHKTALYNKNLFELILTSDYYITYDKTIERLTRCAKEAFVYATIARGNNLADSIKGVKQLIENFDLLANSPKLSSIKAKRGSSLAVMCSTGPSLYKQLPTLKKYQKYVTIISVDTTLPILQKAGIQADYSVPMERDEPTSICFSYLDDDYKEKVIFVNAALQHRSVFDTINKQSNTLVVLRPLNEHMFFGMDEYGYLCHGFSAANMGIELGYFLGYKNIALIGQDLSYGKDGSTHSKGHVYSFNELLEREKCNDRLIDVEAYGGEGRVQTNWYWKIFMDSISILPLRYKNDMNILNCTEGGARIPNTIEIKFKEALEKYAGKNIKKSIVTLEKPTLEQVKEARNRLDSKKEEISQKLKYILKNIDETILFVSDDNELISKALKINQLRDMINSEYIYTGFLSPLVQSKVFDLDVELTTIKNQQRDNEEENLKLWIEKSKEWLEKLNDTLIQIDNLF